eukprot:GHRR01030581.1.p2 GENE.GHRR01030581.1~~GHRR01030581.1.p2  ORF type:complete len:142 (+),score=28.41 GHRR01030581.1:136-561(+)
MMCIPLLPVDRCSKVPCWGWLCAPDRMRLHNTLSPINVAVLAVVCYGSCSYPFQLYLATSSTLGHLNAVMPPLATCLEALLLCQLHAWLRLVPQQAYPLHVTHEECNNGCRACCIVAADVLDICIHGCGILRAVEILQKLS